MIGPSAFAARVDPPRADAGAGAPLAVPAYTRARRAVAEAIGTALLLATVVGSGIMAERLAAGQGAIALLANAVATGAGLLALLSAFQGVSGAHFNPIVTLAEAATGTLDWRDVPAYAGAQIGGAFAGVALAHGMFGAPLFSAAHHARGGVDQVVSEFVATFGLLVVIWGSRRGGAGRTPIAVAAYITAAYWFTASTSFANPAVALARAASDTFTGIRPRDVPPFIGAEIAGGAVATLLCRWLGQGTVPAADGTR